jgi:A/G-specific adenine glycosylase
VDVARTIADWFRAEARDLPWRRPGFPAWGTLVSEFMLQQTQVERVRPRLAAWLERWPTPADLAASPASEAIRAWDRLGYPRRALALHGAATAIVERHGGEVPSDVEALLALPGVGPYTARAVAVFAFRQRHPVVDTNVRRVLARALGGAAEPGPPRTRADLEAMAAFLPEDVELSTLVNAGTMELGAVVCTARAPRCDDCPIAAACAWRAAGYPAYTGPRAPRQARFAGSDREVRGRIMRALRGADSPVPAEAFAEASADDGQRSRALAGLVRDGLVVADGGGYRLPD